MYQLISLEFTPHQHNIQPDLAKKPGKMWSITGWILENERRSPVSALMPGDRPGEPVGFLGIRIIHYICCHRKILLSKIQSCEN